MNFLSNILNVNRPYIIGIAGPSASGKSTLANNLKLKYQDSEVIHFDDYYLDKEVIPRHANYMNWELPSNLAYTELASQLKVLRQGLPTDIPIYKDGHRIGMRTVYPKKLIIVEGLYLYYWPVLRKLIDKKLFLDITPDLQYMRRKRREPKLSDEYFNKIILSSYDAYGSKTKLFADHIINAKEAEASVIDEVAGLLDPKQKMPIEVELSSSSY